MTEEDLNALIRFLDWGILEQIHKYQLVEQSELDEIERIYTEAINEDTSPKLSILKYFENFVDRQNNGYWEGVGMETETLEYKWKRVLDWVVAETIRDSSIMVKWVEYPSKQEDEESASTGPLTVLKQDIELLDLKIIDIDTKLCTKIPDKQRENAWFFKDYAEYTFNKEKYIR